MLTSALHGRFVLSSQSPRVRALDRIISEIAPTCIPVLLVGESGTGKEEVALRLHQLSGRCDKPLVKLVCAGLDAKSLDKQLPARSDGGDTQGLPAAGTVFLDEISELDLACQRKLLHTLPDGGVPTAEDGLCARVISSTRRNMEEQIRSGLFREDLYYRLSGVCLRLPSLRQRREDIPALVDFFLTKAAAEFARPKPSISPQALSVLIDYSWPGNIRQLENAVKKIVALGDEQLALDDIEPVAADPPSRRDASEKVSLKEAARAASHQAERQLILKALGRTRWNRKRAARELQISYKALLYKLKQIGLEDSLASDSVSEQE